MYYIVDALQRSFHSFEIPNIAYEISKLRVLCDRELLCHLELLLLVAGENDEAFQARALFQQVLGQGFAERAGAAGD